MPCSKDRDPAVKTDQFNRVACGSRNGVFCGDMAILPRCPGPAAMARLSTEIPLRSEVTTLRLHISNLPGVASGQLREARNYFGPAVLVQWFSRWGDVPERQEET